MVHTGTNNNEGDKMNKEIKAIEEAMNQLDFKFLSAPGMRTEAEANKFTKQYQELANLRDMEWAAKLLKETK